MATDKRPSSDELAAMLIAHQAADQHSPADDVEVVAKAVHAAALGLSRWVGPDGCNALMTRALNRTRQDHQALRELELVANSAPALAGLAESIETNGAPAVALGLSNLLKELFDLLRRVIGDDLTMRLAEQITGVEFNAEHETGEGDA